MISALIHLVIVVIVVGLLIALLLYVCDTFITPVPLIVKKAIGVIALLLIALYALRVFGYA